MIKTAENQMSNKGIKTFLKNNLFIIIAFLLPALIMGICFILCKFAPFGNNMIMVSDAWHQYYPFLRELQRMLKEGVAPLYSWNIGGGSSFLGVIGNYLGSPLYLLTYFLPDGHIWLQMFLAFTVMLRIGCAGGFMAIFLKKVFGRNDLSLVYFSLMYAFCGYILGYYWNMMWLDTVALLPLVIAGVVAVLKDGKYSLYVISLSLSIIFNFYIGYFVCLFILLFSVCYTIVNFISLKHSLKNACKMLCYTIVAFLITAFITVPVYMVLSHSDSSADTQGFPLEYSVNIAYGLKDSGIFGTVKAIILTATNLLSFTKPITMNTGEPNIFCGALSLVLAVFYTTSGSIKLKEKIVSLSLLFFIILSFVINQLNYIWHGMNTPAMVYYRFSFIFSFVLIVLAYRVFCLIDSFGKKTFIASTGILIVYLAVSFFVQRKLSAIITALAAAVIIAVLLLYKKGKLKYRTLSLLLCIFVICEMSLSAYYGVKIVRHTKASNYPKEKAAVNTLISETQKQSESDLLYRTEFVSPYTLNDGALYSVYGISTFNSMCRSDYSDFFQEFGISSSEINNRYIYYETTPVANLFLNIKYLIARGEITIDEQQKKPEQITDDKYMNQIATADQAILYENTAYVPMGFITDTALLNYQLHESSQLPISTQNEMFSLATGINEDVFTIINPESMQGTDINQLTKHEGFDYYYSYDRKNSTEDEVLTVEYEINNSGSYYGLFMSTDADEILINSNKRKLAIEDKYAYISALGSYEAGDTVSVELPLANKENGNLCCYIIKLNDEIFEKGLNILRENVMEVTELDNRGFKANINVKKQGLLYTSVLYDEGWKVYVDGEEVEITPIANTFVAFELSEGEHSIEFRFTPEGLSFGIATSAVGLAVFAVMGLLINKHRKKSNK